MTIIKAYLQPSFTGKDLAEKQIYKHVYVKEGFQWSPTALF